MFLSPLSAVIVPQINAEIGIKQSFGQISYLMMVCFVMQEVLVLRPVLMR